MVSRQALRIAATGVAMAAVLGGASRDAAAAVVSNLPGFVKLASRLGATDASATIDVVVWLKVRNRADLDKLAVDLYDAQSPTYRHWLRPSEFAERFAPAAEDAAKVAAFLKTSGLAVTELGPKNMYVRARGTVANVDKAFHVQLTDFLFRGETLYANPSEPVLTGAVGSLVQSVSGLHSLRYTHPNATQSVRSRNAFGAARPAAIASATAPPISDRCVAASEHETFKSNGIDYPYVTLKGNGYATAAGALGGCGYTPPEIRAAYGLNKLYSEGFDGTGQTIVIIDWCGSPTIRADANAFSAVYGLPPLTTANFRIIDSSTPPTCGAPDAEINIDVEWAHAIAPGATIDLVVPPSPSFVDVDTAEFFAVINNLGSVISGSYASEEFFDPPAELQTESLINEIAAVQGISANFASGDDGDNTGDFPQYNPASVSAPADSPYATAVGGISLELNADNSIAWQAGWGTNLALLDGEGFVPDPPLDLGVFDFGSGGGASAVFSKPAYQHKLPGTARLLPDISWLGDPFTGAVIVISNPFQFPTQTYQIYGGTSLACPMFSALWAIANQEAGTALGQASQYVYSMPAATITDIKPVGSASNVTAAYQESATTTDHYTAADLAAPLVNTTKYISAIWNFPLFQDTVYVLTFGTDTSLTTTTGWDDVTGVGVPVPKAFADHFKP